MTKKRPGRVKETPEFAGFVARAVTALARRVGDGDIDALADLAALSGQLDTALAGAVTGLRERGYSWSDIGARLGVTKQAAYQRWG